MSRRWPWSPVGPRGITGALEPACWSLDRPRPDLSDVLVWRDPERPWLIQLWEPLRTKAPSPAHARPYCCYSRTVIFYHVSHLLRGPHPVQWRGRWAWDEGGSCFQWDEIETRLSSGLVRFEGQHFDLAGGHVVWRHRRWWMVWAGHRGTRDARAANGVPLDGPSWPDEATAA